ncbi:hypothetical protein ACFO3O_06100 [Dokdonia ponticola]|uniref:Beta-lactamase-inhibitor-like PepSY-like domain-containing protein n=1 Tax=Dokdonia ponticola TaxID=2041041 RepID=A0ABV9HW06_9FLAO
MKTRLPILFYISLAIIILSCNGVTSNQPHTAEGFGQIAQEIKTKFGDTAYFTDILINSDDRIGNIITLTVTESPESMKMGQWSLAQNSWTQTSEITLEVPEGTKAADYMFQLDATINLEKMGGLVEKAKEQLTAEKDIQNPTLYTALIQYPKNGDIANAQYNISLQPETGGTTFYFYYKLDGELIKMDY